MDELLLSRASPKISPKDAPESFDPYCSIAFFSSEISSALIEREIFLEQAKKEGKPEEIANKIVEGRVNKFYQENVLMEQSFVKDPDKSVKDLVTETQPI